MRTSVKTILLFINLEATGGAAPKPATRGSPKHNNLLSLKLPGVTLKNNKLLFCKITRDSFEYNKRLATLKTLFG